MITCNTKILFPFTKGLPYVELLPQRKYNTKSPDLSLTMCRFGTGSTFLCFSFLIYGSRKTSTLLGCCCEPRRVNSCEIALQRSKRLYFCVRVTARSSFLKCFICASLMAFILSALHLGTYLSYLLLRTGEALL